MNQFLAENLDNEKTLLLQKTLRSGQSIHYDGNVVVLGDVNPGAEIVAAGHIVVFGALRGVVHAGASGEAGATVTAFSLAPTQLRIASLITRPPDGAVVVFPEHPEIAKIKDGSVVIERFLPGSEKA
ncbi:MAG: septum site-determining protein MinC [Peptococcaceae bacterium]|nr:septum site-determining protein MinC [Peptococcaceae bacterium]